MRWTVHGERSLYDSAWVNLRLVDVEVPGGPRFDHHVVRMPAPAVGTVVHDPALGVLLLWRHRFIADAWGWEIPAGRVEAGETLEEAARRECVEETGWRPGPLRHLVTYNWASGLSDGQFGLFLADGAEPVGAPSDPGESERIEWTPLHVLEKRLREGEVPDGLSLTALLYAWCFAGLGRAA
ncbi:MAG: NUDIX hydrolase [Acidimicrobiales bacterium]